MKQSIEEQIKIMKAYADGKTVYRRLNHKDLGEKLTETDHQFNFEEAVYSLNPMDWCTGRPAIDAYVNFMRHGSDHDEAPQTYWVTLSTEDPLTKKHKSYDKSAMDTVDTFSIFIAGAEWVLMNLDRGIDFKQSLEEVRKKYQEKQAEQEFKCHAALYNR